MALVPAGDVLPFSPIPTPHDVNAALPLMDALPHPVLWILADYSIRWMNAAARRVYGTERRACYGLSHGYELPCHRMGECCPKAHAEAGREPKECTHAHQLPSGETEMFRVLAIPVAGAGVLEVHFRLGEGLVRDSVSGLYRREFWAEMAERSRALLLRLRQPYSVLFIDLDCFKVFNDRHGHAAGDDALRRVSEVIQANLRMSDAAGRFGGEELVVFMPFAGEREAAAVAERLREAIGLDSLPVPGGDAHITVSIGVYTASADEPLERATAQADRAMYRAKATGRNRVVSLSEAAGERRS